jgi:hypothetical protein
MPVMALKVASKDDDERWKGLTNIAKQCYDMSPQKAEPYTFLKACGMTTLSEAN